MVCAAPSAKNKKGAGEARAARRCAPAQNAAAHTCGKPRRAGYGASRIWMRGGTSVTSRRRMKLG